MRPCWKPDSSPLRSDQGESRTPTLDTARRSERRVSACSTTWPISSTGGNRTHKRSPRFELGRFAGLRTVLSLKLRQLRPRFSEGSSKKTLLSKNGEDFFNYLRRVRDGGITLSPLICGLSQDAYCILLASIKSISFFAPLSTASLCHWLT
jgi:hypothetical protein